MGWKEAKSRYDQKQSLADQKAEDLVARRVLRGLGLVEKQIWDAERAVFGAVKEDVALWPRTKALLLALWGRGPIDGPTPPQNDLLALWSQPDHKDIITRYEFLLESDEEPPIIFGRVKNSELSVAYYPMLANCLYQLTPPFTVPTIIRSSIQDIRYNVSYHLVVQETEHFVRQFGPYEWGEILARQT